MSAKLTVGELVYKISGDMENLKAELKKSEAEITKLKESMEKTEKSTSSFGNSFKNVLKGIGLAYLTKLAVDFGKSSVQAFANAQQSLIQFNNAQENVAGATKEEINSLNEYILALEKKTSVDDKTIRQASQILAQDQIKIENQKKILGGIVDIAVANSKANGAEIDAQGTAVAVGRAFATGDLGGLTRQNIVGIDETTAKAFKLGNEAERTAIMMKLLADNGKGAGEALGNSFQGKINKAKDALEDFQVALGRGITIGFANLVDNLTITQDKFETTEQRADKVGVTFIVLSGIISSLIATVKTLVTGLQFVATVGLSAVAIFVGSAIDKFRNFGKAIGGVSESIGHLVKGEFAEAKQAFQDGFKFDNKGVVKALELSGDAFNKNSEDIKKNGVEMSKAGESITNASEIYQGLKKDLDATTEAQDALTKKTKKQAEASEEAKNNILKLRDKVFDLRKNIDELVVSLGEKLVDATKKFTDSLKSTVTDSAKSLVDITVNAEKEIEDLKKKISEQQGKEGSDVSDLQAQLKEKQRILKSQAEFEAGLNAFVADSKKRADEAALALTTEVDPGKKALLEATTEGLNLQIEALKGFSNLEAQIKEARKLAGEDEFKQAQINSFAKIELATQEFITETAKLREKQAIAIEIEKSITAFYKSETALRQKTLDEFAVTSIATLRRIGAEAKSALAAINAARSAGAQISDPVINPLSTSNVTTPSQSNSNSTTNNNKNVNAPITVNATIKDSTDPAQIARDLAWRLSHL